MDQSPSNGNKGGKKPDQNLTMDAMRPSWITSSSSVRTMETFQITRNELNNISSINTRGLIFGSFAVGLLTYGVDIRLDFSGEETLSAVDTVLLNYGSWTFISLGIGAAILAIVEYVSKNSMLKQIQKETKQLPSQPDPELSNEENEQET